MANVLFYTGPSGQTLYVRIQTGASSFVATALTEGVTSLLNHYSAVDSTIAALTGMNVAGDYPFQVRAGGTPSTTAADTLVATGILGWTGSTETAASTRLIYNKLPSTGYLTGTSSSAGALNLTAAIGSLAASHFSFGALQRISPHVIYSSTVDIVNSQTSISFIEPDKFQTTDALRGAILLTSDGQDYAWGTITHSAGSGTDVAVVLNPHSGTINAGDILYILLPVNDPLSTWNNNPALIATITLTGGASGSSSVTYSNPGASIVNTVTPGMVARITDASTGVRFIAEITSFSSTTCKWSGSLLPFTIQSGIDYMEVFAGGFTVGGFSNNTTTLDLLRSMLPTGAPKLAGSPFSDGSIRAQDISGLTEVIVEAIDQSEIEFSTESLDTMRDHFYGGKLFVKGTVNTSQVTPTTTTFAGDSSLSSSNDFYSKTNAVVAFSTGELQGMCGVVVDYDGAKRQFYFDGVWPVAPQGGDEFVILGKITRPNS